MAILSEKALKSGTTGQSKSKESVAAVGRQQQQQRQQHQQELPSSPKVDRKRLTQDLGTTKGVNQTAVQRDYNKPLTEEEPYIIQVIHSPFIPGTYMYVQNKRTSEISRLQSTTDWYGNPITDPDRSNPTRNRFESPLQTIMSFEYAIAKEESTSLVLLVKINL